MGGLITKFSINDKLNIMLKDNYRSQSQSQNKKYYMYKWEYMNTYTINEKQKIDFKNFKLK
jgi:hypothetical protein